MKRVGARILHVAAYVLTPVGPLVVLLLDRRTADLDALARYHARQALALFLTGVAVIVAWGTLSWVISFVPYYGDIAAATLFAVVIGIDIVLLVLWITGLVHLLRGRLRPLPVIGKLVGQFLSGRKPATADSSPMEREAPG